MGDDSANERVVVERYALFYGVKHEENTLGYFQSDVFELFISGTTVVVHVTELQVLDVRRTYFRTRIDVTAISASHCVIRTKE